MSASYDVRSPRARVPKEPPSSSSPDPSPGEELAAAVGHAIRRTRQWLLDRQDDDGSWCAELEGDTILESETILVLAFLGRENTPLACARGRLPGLQAVAGGGLGQVPRRQDRHQRQREGLLRPEADGPRSERPNTWSGPGGRFWPMAGPTPSTVLRGSIWRSWGRFPMTHCPAVPPEMVLLPQWFPVNLYAMSAWSRTIVVPLSIVAALEPVRPVEPQRGIRELFLSEPEHWPPLRCPGLPGGTGWFSWDHFFRAINRLLKFGQRRG